MNLANLIGFGPRRPRNARPARAAHRPAHDRPTMMGRAEGHTSAGSFGTAEKPLDPDNKSSELTPADTGDLNAAAPRPSEKQIVAEVQQKYDDARQARALLEGRWFLSLAMEQGEQWVDWDPRRAVLTSLIPRGASAEVRHRYQSVNLIRPLILSVAAQVTQTKPDVSFAGVTDSPLDQGAAAEARDIHAHCYQQGEGDQARLLSWVYWTQVTTTAFRYLYWDKTAMADMPVFGEGGQVVKIVQAEVGDLCDELLPGFHVYVDPKAHTFDEARWVIINKTTPLNELKARYGEAARALQPDANTGHLGYVESRLDAISGDHSHRGSGSAQHACDTYVLWEKPSPRYRRGRYVVTASGRVLEYMERWPCDKQDTFPLVPLDFQKGAATVWGRNNVSDLIGPQRAYNRIWSKIQNHIEATRAYITINELDSSKADAFQSNRDREVITYRGGEMPPQIVLPPDVHASWFQSLELLESKMRDICGCHVVSQGQVPGGVTAGNAIELLQQADNTQLAPFLRNIEAALERVDAWRVALYQQFATAPRMVLYSTSDDPGQARARAAEFKNLNGGGQVKVAVSPGSATPKSPAARSQQALEWLQAGVLGQPGMPSTAGLFFKLLEHAKSDEMVELVQKALAEAQAVAAQNQPAPQVVEAVRQQAAAQQLQMQTQHQGELEAIRLHGQMQLAEQKHQQDMEKAAFEAAHPSVSLAGKMGSQSTASAEKAAGLEPDDLAEIKQMNKPKPPAAASAKTTPTKGS